jgi:hypothetical protein
MADIKISNLKAAGSDLFAAEELSNSMRDLSPEELKIRGGKGYSYSKPSYSKPSYSSVKKKKAPYYY